MGLEDNVIATTRGTGGQEDAYLYTKDTRGSMTNLLDEQGNAVVSYGYDEFGETTVKGEEGFYNEFGYTGQIRDANTGLYYYNARYYDPEDGRFITQDTYRGEKNEPMSWNLYAYCANNPINYVDPTGHTFKSLYSTLSKSQKRKLNSKQATAIKKVPSKKSHFSRNKHNTGIPSTLSRAKASGWKKHYGDFAHQFNAKRLRIKWRGRKTYATKKNVKYVKGSKEVIFYYNGKKNDTPEDRGSYNYASGTGDNHTLKDVVPWVAWGNSSRTYGNKGSDRTTTAARRSYVPQTWRGKPGIAIAALKRLRLYGTVK